MKFEQLEACTPRFLLKVLHKLRPHLQWLRKIFTDPVNRGYRLYYLFNYLRWNLYYLPRNKPMKVPLENELITVVYPDSDSGVSNVFTRNVDFVENAFVRSHLQKGDFIVDIGCNVGNRTLVQADRIEGALLIDANELCLERLRQNFTLNNIDLSTYTVLQCAAGSERKTVYFTDLGGTSCTNHLTDGDEAKQMPSYPVQMTTLDYELERIGKLPSFIKIDAEGADLDILFGARTTLLSGAVRLVRFEHQPDQPIEPYLDFFAELGWEVVTLDSEGKLLKEPDCLEQALDLFAFPIPCPENGLKESSENQE